jgi:MFS family permease
MSRSALLTAGALIVAAVIAALPLGVLDAVPAGVIAPLWLIAGFGMGLGMTVTSVLILELSPVAEQGRNSASLQVSDALGGVLGIGLAGAVFAAMHDPTGDDRPVFAGIWFGLAVIAALGAVVGSRTATNPSDRAVAVKTGESTAR